MGARKRVELQSEGGRESGGEKNSQGVKGL
jgi:hypothetical protein